MTHTTEQERAAYERELIDNHHYVPSDFSFKDGFYGGDDDYIQFGWDLWQAARRAPLVIDTRARYSGSIQELKQYASEDVDAMVHICNKHIGNVPKGFFLAMQECAALVGRAPAAPVPQCPFPCGWQNLHALTVAEGAFLARSLNEDEPITAHQRDVVMRVVHYGIEMARTMLAAAPQPPDADMGIPISVAAPVQLPENLREGEPYNDPNFEKLARTYGVWGTAQAALCAEFWQAARRAQVVPDAYLVYAKGSTRYWVVTLNPDDVPEIYKGGETVPLYRSAAAPQPPEAAPVQMPEPAGWIDDGGMVFWNDGRKPNDGEIIYTEQQVRQLLANHGIQERST